MSPPLRAGLKSAAGFVLVMVVGSCGVPADEVPRAIPSDRVPQDLVVTSTTAPIVTSDVETAPIDVYMLNDRRLTAVRRVVAAPPTVGSALATLIQGPSEAEASAGLRSAVNVDAGVFGAQVHETTAVVNVSEAFLELQQGSQIDALAQMVYTVTELEGVEAVQVQLNGRTVAVHESGGMLTRDPLRRHDYTEFAPV